jgi:hypothetical protein
MGKPKLNKVKETLKRTVDQFEAGMKDFQAQLSSDPVHAFQWADTIISLTARQKVAKHYLASIDTWEKLNKEGKLSGAQPQDEDAVVKFIHTSILTHALRMNRFTNMSTSSCANLVNREESAYYAELADEWQYIC